MKVIGRYALFDELARGGMATVHIGRLLGQGGFARTVAIKRLHPHLAKDPEFVTMLLDEARLAGRIQHANVVAMLDVVATDGELFIVMEYVHGEALQRLLRAASRTGERVRPAIASALMVGVLDGLHAAHEVRGDRGEPLGLVHRDVTPHNVMVRRDGTALVVDFGVAKAAGRFQSTGEGKIKGKLPYMAPEQLRGGTVTRRTDIYAAGAVLWETLVGERLVGGTNEGEVLERLLFGTIEPPSSRVDGVPKALDDVVMRALSKEPKDRFANAQEMARALEVAAAPALTSQVAAWLEGLVSETLVQQEAKLASIETIVADSLNTPTDQPLAFMTARSEEVSTGSRSLPRPMEDAPTRAEPPPLFDGAREVRSIDVTPSPIGSSSAVSSAVRPASGWRRAAWVAPLLLAVAIPILWVVARDQKPGAAAAPASAPAAASEAAPPAPSPPVSASVGVVAVTASAPTIASASISAAPALVAAPPPQRPAINPPRTAKPACAPFTIDPKTGRKTYNVDCIQ